jgi:signal peptidase II
MKQWSAWTYGFIIVFIVMVDRLTKLWALKACTTSLVLLPFVSCELMYNRGISCGLFQAPDQWWFMLQSAGIGLVILFISFYTVRRFFNNKLCLGEIMVMGGGIGNMIDRVHYQAVVDFIMVHYHGYQFPTFNVADTMIVLGVGIMLLEEYLHA